MRAWGTSVRWAFALVLASGCNQIFGLDRPAGDDDGSEDARVHDVNDGDGPADRDMDGVSDGVDLCPDVADPAQHDEDRDGRGDRCDLCPHLDQADDTDSDEDGIPDACDPYPGTSGGRLRWSGFHAGDDVGEWQITGNGQTAWMDDSVLLAPAHDSELRLVRVDEQNLRTRTTVIASLTIGPPDPGGIARRAVGVTTNLNSAVGGSFFLCQVETDLPITEVRLADYRLENAVAATIQSTSMGTTLPAGPFTLDFELGPDDDGGQEVGRSARCRVAIGAAVNTLPRTPVTDLAPGLAGVRTVGVPVQVHWVVLIDHP